MENMRNIYIYIHHLNFIIQSSLYVLVKKNISMFMIVKLLRVKVLRVWFTEMLSRQLAQYKALSQPSVEHTPGEEKGRAGTEGEGVQNIAVLGEVVQHA